MKECESCKAKMIWAVSLAGRAIPMDAKPLDAVPNPARELGVFLLLRRTGEDAPLALPLATVSALAFESAKELKVPLFVSHFATCPNAQEHRR